MAASTCSEQEGPSPAAQRKVRDVGVTFDFEVVEDGDDDDSDDDDDDGAVRAAPALEDGVEEILLE